MRNLSICLFISVTFLFSLNSYATNEDKSKYYVNEKSLYIPFVTIIDNTGVIEKTGIPIDGEELNNSPRLEGSYVITMELDETTNNFVIAYIRKIPDFESKLRTLIIGSTRDEITNILGTPTEIKSRIKDFTAFGPSPMNLTEGTPYEEWQYIVDGIVYVVWFAGTSDVSQKFWIMQGTTSYPVDVIW